MSSPTDDVARTFKDAMASVATPVSIVSTIVDDAPFGTTVSAFASLSMDPPMVIVSLDRRSDTLASIRQAGKFSLNILASGQADLALAFARKGGTSKFDSAGWDLASELPRFGGVSSWLACTVSQLVDGGDHVIALGLVTRAECGTEAPLVYHARTFGTHAPHPLTED